MKAKLFEVRDSATFIPMLAIKMDSDNDKERFLLMRAGYGDYKDEQSNYILLAQIDGGVGKITSDPFKWNDRTYFTVHEYIIDHFDELESGAVVDVQYILGETVKPKISERLTSIYE